MDNVLVLLDLNTSEKIGKKLPNILFRTGSNGGSPQQSFVHTKFCRSLLAMVNLMDPVPLAVIVLVVTSVIIAIVFLAGGKKEASTAARKEPAHSGAPAVEKKQPIVENKPAVAETEEENVIDDAPAEEATWEMVDGANDVDASADVVEQVDSQPAAAPEADEAEQPEETAAFEELVEETEDAPLESSEQPEVASDPQQVEPENEPVFDPEADKEPENEATEAAEDEAEDQDEPYEEYDEDVAEYDEAEYNPEDPENPEENEGRESYQDDQHTALTVDTSDTTDSSPRSPTKRTTPRAEGLSPMNNSYKFGSHYQHKKVGDSWVKNSNTAASAAAASPVTVSPVRHSQPRKVIPVSDQEQPLSRKQSTKISQYEEGLQAEKTKVSNKVQETRRRTIEDVVHRVLLEDGELPSEVDPAALIVDPTAEVAAEVRTKKIVKEMKAKFANSGGSVGASAGAGGRSVSVDGEE